MAHLVPPSHKEITFVETVDHFIDNCQKLNGVPKVIESDKDPRFAFKNWQSFMKKINIKLNMSTARHPQADCLIVRVHEARQILLRCYTPESRFDQVSHLPMVDFYFVCSINEASKHSRFEVFYRFQIATPSHR